jgi:hypothetical protein
MHQRTLILFKCILLLAGPGEAFLVDRQATPPRERYDLTSLQAQQMSRRDVLWKSMGASMALVLSAPASSLAASQARVEQWPGVEYLEPIYELKLSVEALSQAAGDASKYPIVTKRLEKFFGGGLLSERNYYAGLGVQYTGQIKYEKNELKEYIRLDKGERFNSMEDALNSLKELFETLKKDSPSDADVKGCVNQAGTSLDRWFALVPPSDMERVGKLFIAARQVDVNRNGKVELEELATMSEEDRVVWKRRVALVGG